MTIWQRIAVGLATAAVVIGLIVGASIYFSPKAVCRRDFAKMVGHDTSDRAFWNKLQQCARDGRLPEGKNDPGFYE